MLRRLSDLAKVMKLASGRARMQIKASSLIPEFVFLIPMLYKLYKAEDIKYVGYLFRRSLM